MRHVRALRVFKYTTSMREISFFCHLYSNVTSKIVFCSGYIPLVALTRCRIKTYPRSTMNQTRMNNNLVIHTHRNIADKLNLVDIGNEFVQGSEQNQTLFRYYVGHNIDHVDDVHQKRRSHFN